LIYVKPTSVHTQGAGPGFPFGGAQYPFRAKKMVGGTPTTFLRCNSQKAHGGRGPRAGPPPLVVLLCSDPAARIVEARAFRAGDSGCNCRQKEKKNNGGGPPLSRHAGPKVGNFQRKASGGLDGGRTAGGICSRSINMTPLPLAEGQTKPWARWGPTGITMSRNSDRCAGGLAAPSPSQGRWPGGSPRRGDRWGTKKGAGSLAPLKLIPFKKFTRPKGGTGGMFPSGGARHRCIPGGEQNPPFKDRGTRLTLR